LKKLALVGVAALLWVTAALPASATAVVPHGRAALLLDGASGQVLYQQNGNMRNYPASTTKLLTALVAVEHGRLDQMVKVSARAVDQPPDSSSCYLKEGEEQRLENLLFGLLLASGNDCAIAIAEGVGNGSYDQFIAWMNETARRVGAVDSHFTNPHGLHEDNHFTTAQDLALISSASLSNPTIANMAATREFFWPGKSEMNGPYYNHHQMLGFYDGMVGGKTGYTEEANLTLVTAASRNGRLLIAVVMGEENKQNQYNDTIELLDYGFDEFETKSAVKDGTSFGTVSVTGGKEAVTGVAVKGTFQVSGPKGAAPKVSVQPRPLPEVTAPVALGQNLGSLEIREGDRLLGRLPLVATQTVAAKPDTLQIGLAWLTTVLKWLLIAFASLFLFRIIVKTTRRFLRRNRMRTAGFRRTPGSGRSIDFYRTR